ncbi:MAG TPA: cysteine hydrolase [Steroidobacteraceae bacterium]|nr:cysteine hydrolase [Steroidobacteraceae bacterium]HUI62499.1 cysteine hydrolase [Steroidobacteraceae bacterium]
MHKVSLSTELLGQIRAQRGELHPFGHLDMRRTAHVIVDLQNGFMEPGAPVEVPAARGIVPNVNLIASAVRRAGGRNVFLRMTVDAESRSSWSNWFAHMHTPQGAAAIVRGFARDAHYWQLWPGLEVGRDDHLLEKTRFGAFVPGASSLHELLQQHGVDTLIITGTLSNCCCESTARDAMQMNYKIIFVADANAALTDAAHMATLENMAMLFADVMTTEDVLAAVALAAPTGHAR